MERVYLTFVYCCICRFLKVSGFVRTVAPRKRGAVKDERSLWRVRKMKMLITKNDQTTRKRARKKIVTRTRRKLKVNLKAMKARIKVRDGSSSSSSSFSFVNLRSQEIAAWIQVCCLETVLRTRLITITKNTYIAYCP